jgi:hypothetical protein
MYTNETSSPTCVSDKNNKTVLRILFILAFGHGDKNNVYQFIITKNLVNNTFYKYFFRIPHCNIYNIYIAMGNIYNIYIYICCKYTEQNKYSPHEQIILFDYIFYGPLIVFIFF